MKSYTLKKNGDTEELHLFEGDMTVSISENSSFLQNDVYTKLFTPSEVA